MAKEVIMPKFGFTQETAQIVRWLKQPGAVVDQGDPIAEVTTDKVNMEVEAPVAGILDGVQYQEGETVPVTQVIAYIRAPHETLAVRSPQPTTVSAEALAQPAPQAMKDSQNATPVATKLAKDKGVDLKQVQGTGPGGRITRQDVENFLAASNGGASKVRAVPLARRLARELGIDLAEVKGSGPRGRVQSADVQAENVRQTRVVEKPLQLTTADSGSSPAVGPAVLKTIPMVGMRRTIATRLQKSAQDAPHIFFDAEIDVTAVEDLRARANERLKEGQPRVSLTAVIAKACAWALKQHPIVNSRIEGEAIVLLAEVNLGVAVALEEGLIVPVVRAADQKGLLQLAAEIADLSERARAGHLHANEVMDGTFTISNLGMFGVDRFTAIINPPQSAILAVSRVSKRVVPDENDEPVVRPMMTVTLSADHRVVDGAVAARFMQDLRDGMEQPGLLTV